MHSHDTGWYVVQVQVLATSLQHSKKTKIASLIFLPVILFFFNLVKLTISSCLSRNYRVYKMNILKKFDHNINVINELDKVETGKM